MSDNRALKLLEAFSGVEESLLERCESAVVDVVKGEQGQEKIISLAKIKDKLKKNSWRYASAAAAVFCLIIVGVASLSGLRMTTNDSAAYEAVMDETAGGTLTLANGGLADSVKQEAASVPATYYVATESADDMIVQTDGAAVTSEKIQKENGVDAEGNMEEKSEAEARVYETLGAYVPVKLPEGYVFESAYVHEEGEVPALMVNWSRGMDFIRVNITLPDEKPATVDVAKPEEYDEYLYEIPHAETVPEEYREVFGNPVCKWEDFSLGFVQKRMIVREDAGDTDTPRGNFSVLYPDGVMVYFNGRGTAEDIWTMFESIN